ncbi:hypothetical protein EUGRSUZ_I02809 [Eucalyptus grandis]|uniref:Uncharacterized protein n=2 Tax=Eucalyptus grandis TaxID=71139 RepID=A0ACC3JK55_EUCGR|nr:hypothetical protein EUGRSUZ_I02809 [Eucalyptus grandis]
MEILGGKATKKLRCRIPKVCWPIPNAKVQSACNCIKMLLLCRSSYFRHNSSGLSLEILCTIDGNFGQKASHKVEMPHP